MTDRDARQDEATIKFSHDKQQGKKGQFQVTGMPGNYTFYFGDGKSARGNPQPGKPVFHSHVWKEPGTYTAWATIDGDRDPWVYFNYRVLETQYPHVEVAAASDRDYTARVTFTDSGEISVGKYTLLFGAQAVRVDTIGEPGTHVDQYFPAGTHKIQVQDHWSGLARVYEVEITDPVYDPEITLTEEAGDTDRRTVKLEVANASGTDRKLSVDWDDGTAPVEIAAVDGTTATHKYDFAGDYVVTATYTDDPDAFHSAAVTVPFADAETARATGGRKKAAKKAARS